MSALTAMLLRILVSRNTWAGYRSAQLRTEYRVHLYCTIPTLSYRYETGTLLRLRPTHLRRNPRYCPSPVTMPHQGTKRLHGSCFTLLRVESFVRNPNVHPLHNTFCDANTQWRRVLTLPHCHAEHHHLRRRRRRRHNGKRGGQR